jgi:hypothetical protein
MPCRRQCSGGDWLWGLGHGCRGGRGRGGAELVAGCNSVAARQLQGAPPSSRTQCWRCRGGKGAGTAAVSRETRRQGWVWGKAARVAAAARCGLQHKTAWHGRGLYMCCRALHAVHNSSCACPQVHGRGQPPIAPPPPPPPAAGPPALPAHGGVTAGLEEGSRGFHALLDLQALDQVAAGKQCAPWCVSSSTTLRPRRRLERTVPTAACSGRCDTPATVGSWSPAFAHSRPPAARRGCRIPPPLTWRSWSRCACTGRWGCWWP